MIKTVTLLFLQSTYSWQITFGLAIVGFVVGFLAKNGRIYKQRKRILYLEDEMLSNHARILELEKKLSERKDFGVIKGNERGSKIS